MKRLLSCLLCIVLVLGLAALPAAAAEEAASQEASFDEAPRPEEAVSPEETALPDAVPEEPEPASEAPIPADEESPSPEDSAAELPPVFDAETPTDALDENGQLRTSGKVAGTNITWSYADGTLTFTGSGAIPDGKAPGEEDSPAWTVYEEKVEKLVISKGITRVGANLASGFYKLTSLNLAEGVTELGTAAFSGCTGLTEVRLPSTLEIIGSNCFAACANFDTGLRSVTFPSGLKRIGSYAFSGDLLASVTLPDGLEYIGEGAFSGNAMKKLTIPGGVELSRQAFNGCANLQSVVLKDGIYELPEECFSGCFSLTRMSAPFSLRVLGPRALHQTKIKSLSLPTVEGYTFTGWADDNGSAINLSSAVSGSYNGTVYALWNRDGGDFTDVPEGAWYAPYVDFCYQAELMNGVSETKFSPHGSATRGQVVTVLWRLAGEPEASGSSGFSDVPSNVYYHDAVLWAAANGVTTGYPDKTFRPNQSVTRQEFVTFLFRFTETWAGKQPTSFDADPLADFSDRSRIASWAMDAERWSVAAGLQEGSKEGSTLLLQPRQSIRRSELAAFLTRYWLAVTSS